MLELPGFDSRTLCVNLTWQDETPVDLTGTGLRFSMRERLGDAQLIKANIMAGGDDTQVQIIDATKGLFEVHIKSDEVAVMCPDIYDYDVEITSQDGHKQVCNRDTLLLGDGSYGEGIPNAGLKSQIRRLKELVEKRRKEHCGRTKNDTNEICYFCGAETHPLMGPTQRYCSKCRK